MKVVDKKFCLDNDFAEWSKESGLLLIPGTFYDKLFDLFGNLELTTINNKKITIKEDYRDSKSPNYIDDDTRFGYLAYGFVFKDKND